MFAVFSNVRKFVKSKKLHIDHCVFRMHYKVSVFFLLGCCALVGSKQYAGEPIRCSPGTKDFSSLVETYCFVTSTYTVKSALNKTLSDGAPHPGIYHSQDSNDYSYHAYYQWIGFLLLFQAMLFYFPHWLWKYFEGGQVERLVEREECGSKDPDVMRIKHVNKIVNALRNRWQRERRYCLRYFGCEFLCLVNVVSQMLMLDKVFHDSFLRYGSDAILYALYGSDAVPNPFNKIFPRVTSCSYRYLGEGGGLQVTSVLCVLAVNVINEKIFLFMWFWFIILGALTLLALTYKLIVFSSVSLRLALLRTCFASVDGRQLRMVVESGDVGDYLFIYLLGQNLEQSLFSDVIVELNSRFGEK